MGTKVFALILLWVCFPAISNAEEKKTVKPNFLFILVDDLSLMDVSYAGSSFHETPHIDRLASGSMKFNWAYAASPMCSPTRASLLTGKSPARHGITQYIAGWRGKNFRTITPLTKRMLEDHEMTMGKAFKEAGYRTAFFGKWHLGKLSQTNPKMHGFDVSKAVIESNRCAMLYPFRGIRYFDDQKEGDHYTEKLTDLAIDFLTEQSKKDDPFLLYLCHFAMHAPIYSKPEDREPFDRKADALPKLSVMDSVLRDPYSHMGIKARQDDAEYAGELKNLDANIGRLVDSLDRLGLADNTVVVFTADNGGRTAIWNKFPHPTAVTPLRGGKTFVYEGGIRIPTFIRWPGVTTAGEESNHPIISMDFYPTMLEMAGLPLLPKQHLDGQSLAPILAKRTTTEKARNLYWHFPHYQGEGSYPASAVRRGNYKLVHNYHFEDYQLFDLKKDPGETKNLIQDHPELAAAMKEELSAWLKETGAELPVKNPKKDIMDHIHEPW